MLSNMALEFFINVESQKFVNHRHVPGNNEQQVLNVALRVVME
jgi:hypothetical protein